jgi:hypothetical protein
VDLKSHNSVLGLHIHFEVDVVFVGLFFALGFVDVIVLYLQRNGRYRGRGWGRWWLLLDDSR